MGGQDGGRLFLLLVSNARSVTHANITDMQPLCGITIYKVSEFVGHMAGV